MRLREPARSAALTLTAVLVLGLPAGAGNRGGNREGDQAGVFDYYVLALSWSPSWCALEGDAQGAEQCDPARALGWVLHGLWPQYEAGYPQNCATAAPDPSRQESAAMADIIGSGGLAWYQWKKHGRCSGLSGRDYYRLSRLAFAKIVRPAALQALAHPVSLPPAVVEAAFLEVNPGLAAAGIAITCAEGRIAEARICLTRDLAPRSCGADVARDCALPAALLDPVR